MKAAILHGKRDLRVGEFDLGGIGPGDVVIDVKACGVCGTDVHMYEGEESVTSVSYPFVLGHEFSGVVSRVGPGVTNAKPGDKATVNPNIMCGHCRFCRSGRSPFCENHQAVGVTRPGGFAEQVKAPALAVHTFARSDFDEASLIEPLSCCLNVWEVMPHRIGDAYLVVGGGPIGMIMLQLARLAGARFVAVGEPSQTKRETCLALGADTAYDNTKQDVRDVLDDAGVREFDCLIDCVGLPATQEYCVASAGKDGKVMFFGLGEARDAIAVHPLTLFQKQVPLYSSFINPYTFERAVDIVESGRLNLKDIIHSRVGLEGVDAALRDASARAGGKVLVVP